MRREPEPLRTLRHSKCYGGSEPKVKGWSPMARAFEHLRVLDLSWGMAGRMTTMFLADNGADVVRIESPLGDPFSEQTGYRVWNRGKRSACIDLQSVEGRQQFDQLARAADVVVDSFSLGTTARLGIDHDALSALNPRIITCSITAYGEHPTHRDRPGYDGLVAARTGLLYDQKGRRGTAMEFINGRPGPYPEFGAPEGLVRGADRDGPIFPRTQWPSIGATYFATLGIAAALRARQISGRGQRVTTSLLQGALAASCLNWQRVENPDAPLYWIGLDTAYRDDPDRVSMESDGLLAGIFLYPQLEEAFKKFPSDQWVSAAEQAGLGMTTVRPPGEALADKSFLADGCVVEVDDPELGAIHHAGPLLEFSATPGAVAGPAPRPGQHTDEVLVEARSCLAAPTHALGSKEPLAHPLAGVRGLDLG